MPVSVLLSFKLPAGAAMRAASFAFLLALSLCGCSAVTLPFYVLNDAYQLYSASLGDVALVMLGYSAPYCGQFANGCFGSVQVALCDANSCNSTNSISIPGTTWGSFGSGDTSFIAYLPANQLSSDVYE